MSTLPKKKKVFRAHLNKELRKAIMLRSRLKNKANKPKSDVDIAVYKKQWDYVVALNKKSKCNYFNKLDVTKGVNFFGKPADHIFLTSIVGEN